MKPFKKLIAVAMTSLMLTLVWGCASSPKQESTGQYLDDSVITTKVKTDIFNEPTLKSFDIKVNTYKGVVQLSGFVSSDNERQKAGEIAQDVKGVKSVENDIQLK